jgi:hypothetical protein
MRLLYTCPPVENSKHSMYFPFVQSLKCPSGAKPLDGEKRALCCRACYSYLQRQWQFYQSEKVPMTNRQFVLRPTSDVTQDDTCTVRSNPPRPSNQSVPMIKTEQGTSPAKPLNIVISSSSRDRKGALSNSSSTSGSSQNGLLAIASPAQFMVQPGSSLPPGMSVPGSVLPPGVSLPGLPSGASLPAAASMYSGMPIPGYHMIPGYSYPAPTIPPQHVEQSLRDKPIGGLPTIKQELPEEELGSVATQETFRDQKRPLRQLVRSINI